MLSVVFEKKKNQKTWPHSVEQLYETEINHVLTKFAGVNSFLDRCDNLTRFAFETKLIELIAFFF